MWQQCSSFLRGYSNVVRANILRSFLLNLQIAAPFTRFILSRRATYQLVSHYTKTTIASACFSPYSSTQEHLRQYEQESAHFHITMNYTHVLIVRLHHQVRQLYHRCVVSYCASAQIRQCYRFLSSRGYPPSWYLHILWCISIQFAAQDFCKWLEDKRVESVSISSWHLIMEGPHVELFHALASHVGLTAPCICGTLLLL